MNNGKLLKISILLLTLIALVFPFRTSAASLEQGAVEIQDPPQVEILNTSDDFLDLTVNFPPNPIYENTAGAIFDEHTYHHPSQPGVPDLPVLRKKIELPYGSGYSVEILDSQSYTGTLGEDGLPAFIPERAIEREKCGLESDDCEPTEVQTPSNFQNIYPASPVQLINTFIVRGHQVGQMEFWPVVYDQANQTLEVFQSITIRISIHEPDLRVSSDRSTAFTSPAFTNLLSDQIINYDDSIQIESTRDIGNEPILIIAPDAFISSLSPLVNLKESQGHPASLVGLSTTGSTPESIKAYIKNAYDNWISPPTYVLLVGDVNNGANSMPAFTGQSSLTVTDLYYGTVDGSDWIPDVFVGRLPARNTTQLNTMINNLAAYDNLTGGEGWVKKAALLASDDANYWQIAEGTQNYVINNHTQPAGYTGTFPTSPIAGGDKLYAHTYAAGNTNVVNAINNRRALIAYSGHGSRVSWGGPSYNQSNIRAITSTGTYSVVNSFACITGDFNETESFGETWLLQPNKGAVAFLGSSASTFWGPDDALERAMMDSLFSGAEFANVVGSFRFSGLMEIEATRPGTGTAQSRYYWESYNLLGDPSLAMLIDRKNTDFTLSADPSSIAICQGGEQSTTVNAGQIDGFNDPISLSTSSAPTGISTSFSANPFIPPNTSTLHLSAKTNTLPGRYELILNGDSNALHHEFKLGLSVFDAIPQTVKLTSPANQQTDTSISQSFTWEETHPDLTYHIQIALDSGFNQVVLSKTGLTQPAFTPAQSLQSSTTYYWRVQALNACGVSGYSTTYQFTTAAAPGDCTIGYSTIPLYQTNFESLPAGWLHYGTNDTWTRSTARSYSPQYAFFSQNKNATSLQHLSSPVISLPDNDGEPLLLNFWHWFDIEASALGCFDGALLEVSNNGGQSWSPVDGSKLLSNGYTGTISTSYGNPMAGSQAWCGSRDWSQTTADLSQFAGQDILLRFTQASDANIGLEGWYIDDFTVSACEKTKDYRPLLTLPSTPIGLAPGQTAIIRANLTNAGLKTDTYTLDLTSGAWTARVEGRDSLQLAPGETTPIEISVTIPEGTPGGQTEQILLSAISLNDPENPPATDTVTIEIKTSNNTYLPIVCNH